MKKPSTKSPASESSAINTPDRRVRGRTHGDASFPVAPASSGLPDGYPDMAALSLRNLLFMRSVAAAYPDGQIVKQLVSQLPGGHVIRLLQRIRDPDFRHWYVKACIDHGWSRNILRIPQNFEGLGV